jgi:ABC-type dipeptide/oligopeptide/nickel transport system permease subunit
VTAEGRTVAAPRAAALAPASGLAARREGARRRWRRLARRPPALAGLVLVAGFLGLALGASWLAPADPIGTDWSQIRKPPSTAHPFGTDDLGRDVLARVVWGTRISMRAGVLSILLAMAVGVPAGLVSGYYRGAVDQVIMRLTDAWLAFPFLVLAIGLVTILGPSLTNATIAIGLGAMPTFVRLTRGLVLAAREEEYVNAARALGGGDGRLMARHVLPNITSAILVQATVSIPAAIIGEAVLSFLGLGVQPPAPSWGTMLNTAQQFLETAPWMAIWPGLAIFLLTLGFNLAGDGIRDVLDPRDA